MSIPSQEAKALSRENVHFRHTDAQQRPVCEFTDTGIISSPNHLTLVIRNDADFATRHIVRAFEQTGRDVTALMHQTYRTWGHAVVEATADHLDYESKYALSPQTASSTNIHFHSSNSLAAAVLKKAEDHLKAHYSNASRAIYISMDDMIHSDVFRQSAAQGHFGEVGFSRLFSLAGEEMGYVGRPGRHSISEQIDRIASKVSSKPEGKTPIVLLEDNVRRAKTLLWIFDQMEKGGLFERAEIAAIATCFSVATDEEKTKIVHRGREVPLLVGVNYAGGAVDVITPRDHLFDGFVVKCHDKMGRIPSFMMSPSKVAANFKILPSQAKTFTDRIHEANVSFCKTIKEKTGTNLPIGWFGPGDMIARVLNLPPTTPMINVLERTAKNRIPNLQLIK